MRPKNGAKWWNSPAFPWIDGLRTDHPAAAVAACSSCKYRRKTGEGPDRACVSARSAHRLCRGTKACLYRSLVKQPDGASSRAPLRATARRPPPARDHHSAISRLDHSATDLGGSRSLIFFAGPLDRFLPRLPVGQITALRRPVAASGIAGSPQPG
jgi:hypothetical protein